MTETNEPCYVVSRTKLDRLMAFAIAYGSNDGSVTEKPMMRALDACCEIQLPKLDPLRFGIVTSEQIDQVIEVLRGAFPLEPYSAPGK